LLDAIGPEGAHTPVQRRPLELLVTRLPRGEGRQLFIHRQELENADPAGVAGLPTADTAVAAEELGLAVPELLGDARPEELFLARRIELLAVLAKPACEALSEHAGDGRAGQERLDAHLVQARERARCVVGVQG